MSHVTSRRLSVLIWKICLMESGLMGSLETQRGGVRWPKGWAQPGAQRVFSAREPSCQKNECLGNLRAGHRECGIRCEGLWGEWCVCQVLGH